MSDPTLNMNDQIELLSVPLPEDVLKHKWHGDFAAMERIIDCRLHSEIEDVMRRRLLLEKCIMKKLPRNYPYTMEQAIELFQDAVHDFQPEEMQELMDSDYADWIYIQGVPHFRNNVVANVLKTRPDYAARRKVQPQEAVEESRALQEILEEMEIKGGVSRTIRQRARLWLEEDAGVEPGEIVKVWLPVPGVDAQIKAVRILDDGTGNIPAEALKSLHIAGEGATQRTIYWEVAWQPGMEFTVEYEFDIEAGHIDLWQGISMDSREARTVEAEIAAKADKEAQDRIQAWKEKYACFDPVTVDDLAEQQPHITFSTMMKELTAQVVGDETRPLEKARLIYNYVTTKIHYSYMRSYATLPIIPEYVVSGHKGDCGAQALVFITMCRIAGIPARWQSGHYSNPVRVGSHDWSRFYIEEYGWLYADVSFGGGGNRSGNEKQRRFYFGNLDPFRMCSCRRFQTNFEPAIMELRSDPYDAQTGEVELVGEKHYRYPHDSQTVMTDYR